MITIKKLQSENIRLLETISKLKKDITYLQNIIHDSPGIIYWKDKSGRYLGSNQFAMDLMKKLGVTKTAKTTEVIGKTDWDLFDNATAEQYHKNDQIVINEKKVLTREELLNLPSGKIMYLLSIKRPLYSADGNIVGIIGTSIDITEQKLAEEREKIATAQAAEEREKIKTIKTISASMAHELRTPLRAIASAASSIKDYFPKLLEGYQLAKKGKLAVPYINPIHYEALLTSSDIIESETDEAFTVINMLLMNVTESINVQDFKICSIHQCVDEALRRYPFDKGEAKLVHWEDEKNFFFKGNELLIIHVLFNLLKNSLYQIKATLKGDIQIWTELGKKYNLLHFRDTAKGIPSKMLPHIFDRFYTATYHGTGIGLAFCKIVMESLGGEITVGSVEGEYAEFVLYFPHDSTLPGENKAL